MDDAWRLICGAGLYRPNSDVLFQSVSAEAKRSLRKLDLSFRAPEAHFSTKARLENEIEDLEREQASLARHAARLRDRGRVEEAQVSEKLGADCRRLLEQRRVEALEVEKELEKCFAPAREANQRERRHWVRRLMLASGEDRQACLAHLDRIQVELAQERIRELQTNADYRIERAANEELAAMRKSMGLKESDPDPDDPWDWNRHRRRGGGGWNCA